MFIRRRNCQTLFQGGCAILCSHQQWVRLPVALPPRQHLLLSAFVLDFSHSNRHVVKPHYSFRFQLITHCCLPFKVTITTCVSSLMKYLFLYLVHSKLLNWFMSWICGVHHVVACLWRPEDHCWEFFLSFYDVGPRDWTQSFRFCGKNFYPLKPLPGL